MASTTVDVYVLTPGAVVWLAVRMNVYRNLLALHPIEVLGIFGSENEAVEACTGPYDICGPVQFNKIVGESEKWDGAYYPRENDH